MSYTYDVFLNFNKELYDFFEWNLNDEIIHVKKIPIIKINDDDLNNITFNKVIICDKELIKTIGKTELFGANNKKFNRTCLFISESDATGVMFDKEGNVIKKSKLLLDDCDSILEECKYLKMQDIDYSILKEEEIIFKTRKRIEDDYELLKKLNILYIEKNDSVLKYLYYELFNKKEDDLSIIYCTLKDNLSDNYNKINNFLKLVSTNN